MIDFRIGRFREKLAPAEIAFIAPMVPNPLKFSLFIETRIDAEDTAREHYNYPDGDPELARDPGDAYRHAYWSARLTQRFGEDFARAFTTAHETEYSDKADADYASFMDTYNNEVGFRIALANPNATKEEMESLIYTALTSGNLVIYDGNDFSFSDTCPFCSQVRP